MIYDVIIPKNYKDAVVPAIAGKKLVGLSDRECRAVIDAIAELAKGSPELFGLVASLNIQYMFEGQDFKPAEVFEDADIAVGNIYLIHNKLVFIRSAYKNRFTGSLLVKSLPIIVDCKQAMLIGSFNKVNIIPEFEVEMTDCYILYTPALGTFWGYSSNDHGEYLKVASIRDEAAVNEGILYFVKNSSASFKLLMTDNPNDKDALIEQLKSIIEQEDGNSLKWFDFDEMELFHIQYSRVIRK